MREDTFSWQNPPKMFHYWDTIVIVISSWFILFIRKYFTFNFFPLFIFIQPIKVIFKIISIMYYVCKGVVYKICSHKGINVGFQWTCFFYIVFPVLVPLGCRKRNGFPIRALKCYRAMTQEGWVVSTAAWATHTQPSSLSVACLKTAIADNFWIVSVSTWLNFLDDFLWCLKLKPRFSLQPLSGIHHR